MRAILLMVPLVLTASGVGAQARDNAQTPPPVKPIPQSIARVFDCSATAAAAERLACYDREVAALQTATRSGEIAVYDREDVRKTRRTLFGIALPELNIFGGGDKGEADETQELSQIESTIRAIRQDANGRYVVTLEDGARWAQIDNKELSAYPRVGQAIRIRRAALGSYLANIGSNTAIRVRRTLP